MSLSKPSIQLTGKKPAGTLGQPIAGIVANVFPILSTQPQPVFKYDLRINCFYPNASKSREVTKQLKEDFSERNRKIYQRLIVKCAVEQERRIFPNRVDGLITDAAAGLYTLDKISIPDEELVITILGTRLANIEGLGQPSHCEVTIKPVNDSFQCSTGILDNYFLEFANLAVLHRPYQDTDNFIIGKSVVAIIEPEAQGFAKADSMEIQGGCKIIPAIKKSVKILEGQKAKDKNERAKPSAFLVLDVSKHVMHQQMPLAEKIQRIYEGAQLGRQFQMISAMREKTVIDAIKYLEVLPTHRPGARTFGIRGVGGPANKEMILQRGMPISVYFEKEYGYHLKHPEWPTIRDQHNCLHPIEVLEIMPYQHLRKTQEFKNQSEIITRDGATIPGKRKKNIQTAMRALALGDDPFLQKTGLKVFGEQLYKLTSARQLPNIRINYGGGQFEDPIRGRWKLNKGATQLYKFHKGAQIGSWQILAIARERDLIKVCGFAQELVKRAAGRSMGMGKPKKISQIEAHELEDYMTEAVRIDAAEYILVITDKDIEIHAEMKSLECRLGVVTQEMRWSVCARAVDAVSKHQYQIIDNFLAKTNVKNGGLNHSVQFTQNTALLQNKIYSMDRLIIGIEMSHSNTGQAERRASVIGWAANLTPSLYSFTGNYHYVKPRETEPDLTEVFNEVMARLKQYRNGRWPKSVDLYMGGVADGAMGRVAKSTVEALYKVCAGYGAANPEITLIYVSQDHVERLMPEKSSGHDGDKQNVPPGLCVDREIVHPNKSEFYLMSCEPVQGTAKCPKYMVAVDTMKRSMDELEMETWSLCFLHQFHTGTTSIPTPAYCAKEYAERGADVLPFLIQRELNDESELDELNKHTYQSTILDGARLA